MFGETPSLLNPFRLAGVNVPSAFQIRRARVGLKPLRIAIQSLCALANAETSGEFVSLVELAYHPALQDPSVLLQIGMSLNIVAELSTSKDSGHSSSSGSSSKKRTKAPGNPVLAAPTAAGVAKAPTLRALLLRAESWDLVRARVDVRGRLEVQWLPDAADSISET